MSFSGWQGETNEDSFRRFRGPNASLDADPQKLPPFFRSGGPVLKKHTKQNTTKLKKQNKTKLNKI